MSIGETQPRIAIILPHPTLPETSAIDLTTGALPGMRFPEPVRRSQERAALDLAETVTGRRDHGSAYMIRGNQGLPPFSLLVLKPSRTDELHADGRYGWLTHDIDAIKSIGANIDAISTSSTERERLQAERAKMISLWNLRQVLEKAMGRHADAPARTQALDTARDVVISYLAESAGMYGLQSASTIVKE